MARTAPRKVVSVTTTPRGQMEDFVFFGCPDCEWHSGDWSVKYEEEARQNYVDHWKREHAPAPPDPEVDRWTG